MLQAQRVSFLHGQRGWRRNGTRRIARGAMEPPAEACPIKYCVYLIATLF
ncbi:hypothetical protein [Mucilaginibacter lacusdianchii]|nr:hypothetical protein [Mucilaginibacter sp. JXJ CY 39]